MVWVIGYEGYRREGVSLSWGAAAIRDGQVVLNAATGQGRVRHDDEIAELAATGAITRLPEDIQFRGLTSDARPVVIEVLPEVATRLSLDSISKRVAHRAIGSKEPPHAIFFVYRDSAAFESVRTEAVNRVCHTVLYDMEDRAARHGLISEALTLDAHNGELNALWAWFADPKVKDRAVMFQRAQARLRSDEAKVNFAEIKEALEKLGEDYVISIEGLSKGGGMDIGPLLSFLSAFLEIHRQIKAVSVEEFPFINAAPDNHVQQVLAASAVLTFRPGVEGRPLGEQIARYLELKMIHRMLANAPDAPHFAQLESAIRRIAAPEGASAVKHRMLDRAVAEQAPADVKEQLVLVASVPALDDARKAAATKYEPYSPPLTLLGYQSGSYDWQSIQFSIAPGFLINVSAFKDRSGREPMGVDTIRGKRRAYARPVAVTVVRQIRPSGRIRYHLQHVHAIESKPIQITAFPSRIVFGGFVMSQAVSLRMRGNNIVISDHTSDRLTIPSDSPTLDAAQQWMRNYAEDCERMELADLKMRRLPPIVMQLPSDEIRLLWALETLGGEASSSDVRSRIVESFGKGSDIYNVARVAGHHEDHVAYDTSTNALTLLQAGLRYLGAYRAFDRRAVQSMLPPAPHSTDDE